MFVQQVQHSDGAVRREVPVAGEPRRVDGHRIGVAFQPDHIVQLSDKIGNLLDGGVSAGGDRVFPGWKKSRLLQTDYETARFQMELNFALFDLVLQFLSEVLHGRSEE